MKTLRKGMTVEWTSQARGVEMKKIGKVVCRVPADTCPVILRRVKGRERRVINPKLAAKNIYDLTRISCNRTRSKPSYLVAVPQPGGGYAAKDLIYWPRMQDLTESKGKK